MASLKSSTASSRSLKAVRTWAREIPIDEVGAELDRFGAIRDGRLALSRGECEPGTGEPCLRILWLELDGLIEVAFGGSQVSHAKEDPAASGVIEGTRVAVGFRGPGRILVGCIEDPDGGGIVVKSQGERADLLVQASAMGEWHEPFRRSSMALPRSASASSVRPISARSKPREL